MDFNFEEIIKSKTDEELSEIYLNRGNYQDTFFEAATKELERRSIALDSMDKQYQATTDSKIELLSEGKEGNTLYLVCCAVFALFGGLVGIIGGYIYAFSKVHTPEGSFYTYNDKTRQYGKVILFLGLMVLIISIAVKTRWFVL